MKIQNAVAKLTKAGFEVTEYDAGKFRAVRGRHVVGFYRNGAGSDRATCFHTTTTDADAYSSPLFGWSSLTSIIRSFDRKAA